MRRAAKRNRRGYTLREIVVAMTLGSTLMIVSAGLLTHSFGWAKMARHRRQDDQSYFRLQSDLRQDLHSAASASVSASALEIALQDNTTVAYEIDDQSIRRTETREGDPVRRESYRWKIARDAKFQENSSLGQIELVVKTITPYDPSEVPVWRATRTTLGLRLRHQNGEVE